MMNNFVKGTKNYFRRLLFGLILLGISIGIIEVFSIELTGGLRTIILTIAVFGAWVLELIYLKIKGKRNDKQ